jgi:hypothetical protein
MHLGNFSIRSGVGSTRAPPRGEPVAPLSIMRPSLSTPARVAWRPPRMHLPLHYVAYNLNHVLKCFEFQT